MSIESASLPRPLLNWAKTPRQDTRTLAPSDHAHLEDRELAALAAGGTESAFRELLTRYERPVFSLIYRMVRDRTLAEDLAQEAFIRAFNAIGTYKTSYKFSNWILKIANNHTIDYLRKRKLETVSIDGSPHATTADEVSQTQVVLESRDENPQEYVEHKELGGQIEAAIGGLAAIARETGAPVTCGVLTTETLEQALQRAGGKAGHKGFEAAQALLECLSVAERIAT